MRKKILALYKNRCIMCRKTTKTVHEKTPKSLGKDWERAENMVPLCSICHEEVHTEGAMNVFETLSRLQENVLSGYYGTTDYEQLFKGI